MPASLEARATENPGLDLPLGSIALFARSGHLLLASQGPDTANGSPIDAAFVVDVVDRPRGLNELRSVAGLGVAEIEPAVHARTGSSTCPEALSHAR